MTNGSIAQQLKTWQSGPLPDGLDVEASRLFGLDHDLSTWVTVAPLIRHDYRQRIVALSLRLATAMPGWTLDTAHDHLTAASLQLLYGNRDVTEAQTREVRDYAEAYLEDLSRLFGDRATSTPSQVARLLATRVM